MKRDPLSFPAWPLHLSLGEKWGGLTEVHHSSIVVEIGIWNGTGRKKGNNSLPAFLFFCAKEKNTKNCSRGAAIIQRARNVKNCNFRPWSNISITYHLSKLQLDQLAKCQSLTYHSNCDQGLGCTSIRCFQATRKIILYAKLVLRHSWSKCFSKMHLIWVCLLLSYYYAVASRSLLANFDARL